MSDSERGEWERRRREQDRRDAETLVPRPGCPLYGVAAPSLTPASVVEHQLINGEWTSIMLAYGPPDAQAGPYVAVTTEVTDAPFKAAARVDSARTHGDGPEAELRRAVESERGRLADWAGATAPEVTSEPDPPGSPETSEALVVSRQTLPAGPALVCRSGIIWAARLLPADPADPAAEDAAAEKVVVSIVGRGVAPESVLLEPLANVRPMIEARAERIRALLERGRQRPRPPLPELEPAQGAAVLLALAEFTLATNAELRASGGNRDRPRRGPEWAGRSSALWQRAIREHQRLRGTDERNGEDAVMSAVNQLGFLQEQAPWFAADPRLRAAAIDETARYTMLGDHGPSEPRSSPGRATGPPTWRWRGKRRRPPAPALRRRASCRTCSRTWRRGPPTACGRGRRGPRPPELGSALSPSPTG